MIPVDSVWRDKRKPGKRVRVLGGNDKRVMYWTGKVTTWSMVSTFKQKYEPEDLEKNP